MQYVPIIKPKDAELKAIADTGHGILYPLIELTGGKPAEPARPGRNGRPDKAAKAAQTPEDHLENVRNRLASHWGEQPILMDPHLFLHRHPDDLQTFIDTATAWHTGEDPETDVVNIIPVLRVSDRMALTAKLGRLATALGHGLGIRVTRTEVLRRDVSEDIAAFSDITHISNDQIDVVLDMGCLVDQDVATLINRCTDVVEELTPYGFRSITVAATGFNGNPREEHATIPRQELPFWVNVQNQVSDTTDTIVNFGDYGIDAPEKSMDPTYIEMGVIMPTVALRYTYTDHLLFLKEASPRTTDPETGRARVQRGSFRQLCQRLVALPQYMGPDFSTGDTYFQEMASGRQPSEGRPTDWKQASYSHHYIFIQRQLEDDFPEATDADDEPLS